MQYKIPVQIENEDRIILGLSLRQLMIILAGGALAYGTFQKIAAATGQAGSDGTKLVGGVIAFLIIAVAVGIAKFNHHEMTFLPFTLNWLRMWLNRGERYWGKGVDSYPALAIGYVAAARKKDGGKSGARAGHEIYSKVEDKLKNL